MVNNLKAHFQSLQNALLDLFLCIVVTEKMIEFDAESFSFVVEKKNVYLLFSPPLKNDWKYGFNFQWATKLKIINWQRKTKKIPTRLNQSRNNVLLVLLF